jgi:hypothetical protein
MSFIQKSEELLQKWCHGWAERWYERNGIEHIRRFRDESPTDQELEQYLQRQIENMKYEDEKIAKIRNEEFWIGQAAAMRALREECKRIRHLHEE